MWNKDINRGKEIMKLNSNPNETVLNSLNIANGEDTIFLLGAGCSINSGCMAASKLVFEFKKRIYCINHGIQLDRDVLIDETRLGEVLEKEFPIGDGTNQYSYFFERCFSNAYDRNQFIKNEFHDKKPSFGYLCFANYLISKKVRYVLTTNFDLLIERAVHKIEEEYDLVNVSENETPYLPGVLNIVKLHGDYNYDKLKNTENELRSISDSLLNMLLNVKAKRIFVLGYSGQDLSVMSFFESYLTKNTDTQLIWCGLEDTCQNEKINNLLSLSESSNYICISGFDSLFEEYYHIFGPANKQLDALYIEKRNTHFDLLCTNQPEQFKYNAFPLIGNAKIYKSQTIIDLDRSEAFYFTHIRGKTYVVDNKMSIERISQSHNVLITICDVCEEPIPLTQKCKLIKELVKWSSFERGISLFRDNLYIDNKTDDIKEGLKVSVDLFNQKICLILNPNYFICGGEITNSQKYNINRKKSSLFVRQNWELLQKMIDSIFAKKLVFSGEIGVEFSSEAVLQDTTQQIYECIKEPLMVGNQMQSVNQLKILDSVGPKETLFSKNEIRVGIFCCEEDKPLLKTFLDAVENGDAGNGSGVIPQYRGFLNTFKKKIVFDYDALPTINTRVLIEKPMQVIVPFYMRGLEKMYKERQIDIAVIYIGESLKGIRTDGDYDFHNMIKLFSANKYKTQLLEEKTIKSSDNRSKILLNFAIGLYTKTIGMPWYPQNYSKDTLFLGICFGRDSQGITVGCSQMFDGAGRGMQLIISQVSDKKRKNQYLNKYEAFELGKKIRQTYYRSSKVAELERIVIHRSDPFRLEEIEGFKKAFEGINDFVLLQIVEGTSFNVYPFNRYGCCGYPAKRGTIIKASNDTAYVWTDGSVVEGDIDNGRTYRNSKRGMGRPLKIKKCYGNISLNDVVRDLMYLTKMDFNSSDVLYSKLPVTIKYSRIVCDIVKQGNFSDELISFEYVM